MKRFFELGSTEYVDENGFVDPLRNNGHRGVKFQTELDELKSGFDYPEDEGDQEDGFEFIRRYHR